MIVENKATFLRITRDFVRILFDFKDDAVVVVQVEPGSAAFQHFQYGDVLEKVNGEAVTNTDAAKRAIRESIQNKRSVILKVIRNVKKKSQTEAPQDVRFIMRRHYGFWNRAHKLGPCEETESEGGEANGTDQRLNVYHVEDIDVQRMTLDDFGRQLTPTPPRAGGSKGDTDAATSSTIAGGGN
uniref:PDZ domain-containing protein n=2 Tax=Meloidogyne hapla TaxID=6305 RepID=A0A1I8BWU9_MELHA